MGLMPVSLASINRTDPTTVPTPHQHLLQEMPVPITRQFTLRLHGERRDTMKNGTRDTLKRGELSKTCRSWHRGLWRCDEKEEHHWRMWVHLPKRSPTVTGNQNAISQCFFLPSPRRYCADSERGVLHFFHSYIGQRQKISQRTAEQLHTTRRPQSAQAQWSALRRSALRTEPCPAASPAPRSPAGAQEGGQERRDAAPAMSQHQRNHRAALHQLTTSTHACRTVWRKRGGSSGEVGTHGIIATHLLFRHRQALKKTNGFRLH